MIDFPNPSGPPVLPPVCVDRSNTCVWPVGTIFEDAGATLGRRCDDHDASAATSFRSRADRSGRCLGMWLTYQRKHATSLRGRIRVEDMACVSSPVRMRTNDQGRRQRSHPRCRRTVVSLSISNKHKTASASFPNVRKAARGARHPALCGLVLRTGARRAWPSQTVGSYRWRQRATGRARVLLPSRLTHCYV
jgi:hypothetical protein